MSISVISGIIWDVPKATPTVEEWDWEFVPNWVPQRHLGLIENTGGMLTV